MEVANKCIEILKRMHPSDDTRQQGIPDDLVKNQGDVLGFLFGQKSIEEAVTEIRRQVNLNPVLKSCVQVLPFYSGLPIEEQQKVIEVGKNPPPGITSVIIATNAAETSLTLKGVKHVVETGLINRANWDTETETSEVKNLSIVNPVVVNVGDALVALPMVTHGRCTPNNNLMSSRVTRRLTYFVRGWNRSC